MIFWYEPPKSLVKTSVQQGRRPWLVISNDEGNISAPTCNIVPTTTEDKTHIPTHVTCWFNGQKNTILCEQCITVDQNVLKDFICVLTDETMSKVEEALSIQYSIRPVVKYGDFNMDNLVHKLENIIGEIIEDKVKQKSQVVPQSTLEDSALRLGQLIEDLVGGSNKTEVKVEQPVEPVKVSPVAIHQVINPTVKEPKIKKDPPAANKPVGAKLNKTRQKWTTESRCQFLRDCDTMSPDAVKEKYGFTTVGTVFATKYNCKNILNEMGVDYKNAIDGTATNSN